MLDARVPVRDLTGVSETLLIPLVAHVQARTRFPDPGFAEAVLNRLDIDPDRVRPARPHHALTAAVQGVSAQPVTGLLLRHGLT